jgi:predicted esterase
LQAFFPADDEVYPPEPSTSEATARIMRAINKGMTQVLALRIDDWCSQVRHDILLHKIQQRVDDPALLDQLHALLATYGTSGLPREGALAALFAGIYFGTIDRLLARARELGRQDGVSHIECFRVGGELIILADAGPQHDWLLPSLRARLREGLAELRLEIEPATIQATDLTKRQSFTAVGCRFRYVRNREGTTRAECTPLAKQAAPWLGRLKLRRPRLRIKWRFPGARWVPRSLSPRTRRVGIGMAVVLALGIVCWLIVSLLPGRKAHGFLDRSCHDAALGGEIKYVVFIPHDYAYRGNKRYPLIVFLHGLGDGNRPTLNAGIPCCRRTFEFITVMPESKSGYWPRGGPDIKRAMTALKDVENHFRVDPKRVYLTGVSDGGLGTWNMAAEYPDRWAAIVPLAGWGYPDDAARISHIPCWCFHAGNDRPQRVKKMREMIEALKAAGGHPRYTEMIGAGLDNHVIADRVYRMPEVSQWMLQHQLE